LALTSGTLLGPYQKASHTFSILTEEALGPRTGDPLAD